MEKSRRNLEEVGRLRSWHCWSGCLLILDGARAFLFFHDKYMNARIRRCLASRFDWQSRAHPKGARFVDLNPQWRTLTSVRLFFIFLCFNFFSCFSSENRCQSASKTHDGRMWLDRRVSCCLQVLLICIFCWLRRNATFSLKLQWRGCLRSVEQ